MNKPIYYTASMPQLGKHPSAKSMKMLFQKRTRRAKNGCLVWLGSRFDTGYGRLRFLDATLMAHRVAYELYHGSINEELLVCHSCDNPPCVEETHLFQGNNKANQQDMVKKMRGRFGARNGRAITTASTVRTVRKKYATGKYTQKELGEVHGLTQITVSNIVTRKTWRHLH
jgi:HNH endonuclease